MENENQASNVQLQGSEHEELIGERSEEKSPITEVCEISASGTSGSVTPEVKTPEEDLSDIDARSDENSPCKETYGSEVTQHTPGRDSAENKPQENDLPNSPHLDLQLSTTYLPDEVLSEPEVPGDSLEVEITQLLSPSPEPIEIDIPERSDCSSEVPRLPESPNNEPQDHSGSDADNECSDEEPIRALGDWQSQSTSAIDKRPKHMQTPNSAPRARVAPILD